MRERKVERAMRKWSSSSKVKQYRGITVINATAPSMAKKTRRLFTVGASKTYSNRRGRENECSSCQKPPIRK